MHIDAFHCSLCLFFLTSSLVIDWNLKPCVCRCNQKKLSLLNFQAFHLNRVQTEIQLFRSHLSGLFFSARAPLDYSCQTIVLVLETWRGYCRALSEVTAIFS